MTFYLVGDEKAFDSEWVAAGNASIGLLVRAASWCCQQGTGGRVPAAMASLLGTRREIEGLLRVGLWTRDEDGSYLFTPWTGPTQQSIETSRAAATARKRRSRTKAKSHADVTCDHGVTDPDVTPHVTRDGPVTRTQYQNQDLIQSKTAAAAAVLPHPADAADTVALGLAAEPAGLPAATTRLAVEILASRAAAAGLVVRWDTLTAEEVAEVAGLVQAHGDQALITAAQRSRSAHSTPPASARAWLGTWRAMPPPGQTLTAVPDLRCPDHDTEPARTCRSCAADRKAACT